MEKHEIALFTLMNMLKAEKNNREFCAGEIEVTQGWIDHDVKERGFKPDKRHVDRLEKGQKFLAETEERIANLEESIATLEVDD